MALELAWDRPLHYRKGGRTRLDGIDVYYEFVWHKVVGHSTSQFTNGQCLALFVREACPDGKTPVLLLTDRDEVEEGSRETDSQFVFVLNLPRYLKAHADAALSYLGSRVGPGITRPAELHEIAAARPEVVKAIISSRLTLEDIAAWAADNTEHLAQLRGIAGVDASVGDASLPDVIAALEAWLTDWTRNPSP